MFGAELRNFQAYISGVYHLLVHAIYFVTGDYGITIVGDGMVIAQVHAPFYLLKGTYGVAL